MHSYRITCEYRATQILTYVRVPLCLYPFHGTNFLLSLIFCLLDLTRFQLLVELLRLGCILRKEANATTTDKFLHRGIIRDILRIKIILIMLTGTSSMMNVCVSENKMRNPTRAMKLRRQRSSVLRWYPVLM